MKTLLKNTFILSIITLMFSACEKDQELTIAKSAGTPATLTASVNTLELDETKATQEAITFTWSKADFGYSAAVDYSLEFRQKGGEFKEENTLNVGSNLENKYTVAAINTVANRAGLTGFKKGELEVRVKAEIGGGIAPVYSNVVTLAVTPYLDKPPYQTLYIVGGINGWNNTTAIPMFRDATDIFNFTFTGFFPAGDFKILGKQGSWTPMWGNNGTGGVQFRATDADADPASFNVATDGYYTITLSLRNNTMTIVPYNAAAATVYPSIGIIGAFNNWSDIVPMTNPTANNPHIWTVTHTLTSESELKFRIASGWDVSWGMASTAITEFGVADGGNNFKLAAGTYQFIFNDLTKQYVFVKK